LTAHNSRDYEGQKANRLMSIIDEIWVIHLQKVDTLSTIGIDDKYFHFIPVIMVLYINKYWQWRSYH
jgi:hypothetical protein